jgi:LPPG:FO 2-phospho-L-lactate transferase
MKVVALSGGVGGARLVDGLARALGPDDLTVVVNTGDDFEHWGLWISPDLDTVMYTLAGLSDEARGWGLEAERWDTLEMVRRYGGDGWFQLGNRDLATHILRTEALRRGEPLSAVTDRLRRALGVTARILPMCDAPRPTRIRTAEDGTLSFQTWLVGRRGAPAVDAVDFVGATEPADGVVAAIRAADAVIVPPSNPYVSVDPILTLDGVREAVAARPTIAVSPIVGGRAMKGPLAAMIPRLAGVPPSAAAVARHYGGLLDGYVCEAGDGAPLDCPQLETATVMRTAEDRLRLAREVLAFTRDVVHRRGT